MALNLSSAKGARASLTCKLRVRTKYLIRTLKIRTKTLTSLNTMAPQVKLILFVFERIEETYNGHFETNKEGSKKLI